METVFLFSLFSNALIAKFAGKHKPTSWNHAYKSASNIQTFWPQITPTIPSSDLENVFYITLTQVSSQNIAAVYF